MTPFEHSVLSVRDFGGTVEDYLEIHSFIDSTKFQFTDYRHRALLHNPLGMQIAEQLFGHVTKNNISVREIVRQHIIQDCGIVPTTKECVEALSNNTYINFNKPNKKDLDYLKLKLYKNGN